jgi:diguanylate cyclase (GGDEF)-like protein/PAS domain S-box-containing protein
VALTGFHGQAWVAPVTLQRRHIEALRELGETLGRTPVQATEVAQVGADAVARHCGDACGVWGFQGRRLVLLGRAGSPDVEDRLSDLLPAGEKQADPTIWHEHRTPEGVLLPLVADGRVLGVLGALRRTGARAYDEDQLDYLRTVADRLAAATALAGLHRDVAVARTRSRALLQRSADGVLVVDDESRIVFAGGAVSELLGVEAHDLLGTSALDLVHPDHVVGKRRLLADALSQYGVREPFDVQVRRADGSWLWVEDRVTNMLDDPDVAGLVINFHDVSDRKQAQDALARSESRYRSIAQTAQEGIWVVDPDGRTAFANQKLAEILDRPLREVYRLQATDIVLADARGALAERLQRRERTGHEVYELPFVRGDGELRLAQVSASPLFDGGKYVGSLGMFTDVTDRKHAEEQLERQALYDGLTGLANRALLADRLSLALARRDEDGTGVVVLFVDLDHFKAVNDTYGHATGDQLLVQVADRLSAVVRMADTVARFAGDEFVVVCPGLDERGANALAGRALAALASPFQLDGVEVQLSASLGIAHASAGQDSDTVVDAADAAMLEAKRRGRGVHATFDSAIAARAGSRLQEMADIRRGLEAGEFVLCYQPEVDLVSNQVVAVEALARWRHPTRGLLYPADFIPLAERTGLIVPLGRTVLRAACLQGAEWARASSTPPRLAVNVSARQLHDERLVDLLRDTLQETGLAPELLRLELTESTVMDDTEQAVRVLAELSSLGVGLSVDDFGTGSSSLAYLTRLPLDELKIDREFVAGVHLGGEDLEVVRAAIAMGHALDLQVVAEGVETDDTVETLRELGCDVGQGYAFAAPDAAPMVSSLLARGA